MTGWLSLRRQVYRRDGGSCQVCLLLVGKVWDTGHLVDRCVGGDDSLENLVLMCVHCNRRVKPIHTTRDEARAWLRAQQDLAAGRPPSQNWRPFHEAMYSK